MKMREIRELDTNAAKENLVQARADIAKSRAQSASGTKQEKPGKIKQERKTIARLLTLIRERELGIHINAKAVAVKKEEKKTDKAKEKKAEKAVKKTDKAKKAKKSKKGKAEKKTVKKDAKKIVKKAEESRRKGSK